MLSFLGGRDDALVRALTSHPSDLGSTPERGFTYWLGLLSVVVLAPTVYLQVFQFSSLRKKQNSHISGEEEPPRGIFITKFTLIYYFYKF